MSNVEQIKSESVCARACACEYERSCSSTQCYPHSENNGDLFPGSVEDSEAPGGVTLLVVTLQAEWGLCLTYHCTQWVALSTVTSSLPFNPCGTPLPAQGWAWQPLTGGEMRLWVRPRAVVWPRVSPASPLLQPLSLAEGFPKVTLKPGPSQVAASFSTRPRPQSPPLTAFWGGGCWAAGTCSPGASLGQGLPCPGACRAECPSVLSLSFALFGQDRVLHSPIAGPGTVYLPESGDISVVTE